MPAPSSAPLARSAPIELPGLFAVQDESTPFRRDQAARRGGERALDALGRAQLAILSGDSAGVSAALDHAVTTMTDAADPVLDTIIRAIRLRARIEQARATKTIG